LDIAASPVADPAIPMKSRERHKRKAFLLGQRRAGRDLRQYGWENFSGRQKSLSIENYASMAFLGKQLAQ
jgi:hypothetical protein